MVHVAMFAKYWLAGKVKTRLAGRIGDLSASQIYLAFVRHLLDRLSTAGDCRSVVYSPADAVEKFRSLAGGAWELRPQCDGDLGTLFGRFQHNHGFRAHHPWVDLELPAQESLHCARVGDTDLEQV